MKTKNIVFIAKSLDGYIAGKNGELDWLNAIPNPDNNDMGFNHLMEEIDVIVMGRTTFEMVSSFGGAWPYSKPLFVLSNSLKKIPTQLQDKVSLLKGTPQEITKHLHAKGFFNLYIDGGRTIQFFLNEDLIDKLIITTIPILLGDGVSLFDIMPKPLKFKHLKTEVFINQIVQSQYERNRTQD